MFRCHHSANDGRDQRRVVMENAERGYRHGSGASSSADVIDELCGVVIRLPNRCLPRGRVGGDMAVDDDATTMSVVRVLVHVLRGQAESQHRADHSDERHGAAEAF